MKLSKKSTGNFQAHPETDAPVRAVIVDVTPLKTVQSDFGEREVFKLVYETEVQRDDSTRFCVWSRPYTPSLNEKANFRKDLRKILGRDLTAQEEEEFDTEKMIGTSVLLMVEHSDGSNGQTYANVALLKPYNGDDPLTPSGSYIRVKDREQDESKASYQRSEGSEAEENWESVKVHVGKHEGVFLRDLDEESVTKLIENWLPEFGKMEKPLAVDKKIAAGLKEVQSLLGADAEQETEPAY